MTKDHASKRELASNPQGVILAQICPSAIRNFVGAGQVPEVPLGRPKMAKRYLESYVNLGRQ